MMFCEPCRRWKGWNGSLLTKSRGLCEVCGVPAVCHDVPSSRIEVVTTPDESFRPLTAEEAEAAYRDAPAVPMSDERIAEIMRYATGGDRGNKGG